MVLFIYLFIYEHKQTEVLDLKAPPSGHNPCPFSLTVPSRVEMCLCSCLHSQGQLSLSLKSSLTVKTCCMYLTRSASLSRDFPSLRLAWKGHHRIWLWESMFPHSEHFHSCFAYSLLFCWFKLNISSTYCVFCLTKTKYNNFLIK